MPESTRQTLGPLWVSSQGRVIREYHQHGSLVAILPTSAIDDDQAGAYGRLFAAAPELLAALDEADTAFATFNVCGDCPQTRGAVREAWAKVSAAYAKATGRPDRFAEANSGE